MAHTESIYYDEHTAFMLYAVLGKYTYKALKDDQSIDNN